MSLKAAIIGYGYMGKIRERVLREHPAWEIAGVYDHEQPQDRQKGWKALVGDPGVDAVFVCVPNYQIKPMVLESLKNGKHVFAEKPPGLSSDEVIEMAAAEKTSSRILKYGFNHRYHPAILKAKELVDSNRYGDILWVRGRYGKSVDPEFHLNWRAKKDLAGGGILMDQGIHMVDLFLYFCNRFSEAKAFASNSYWQGEVEDNVFAILRNEKGQLAQLHSTMTQWRYLFSLEIFLSNGYIVVNGLLSKSGRYGPERLDYAVNRTPAPMAAHSDVSSITFNIDRSWKMELDEFTSSIIDGNPIIVGNSDDAFKLMKTIEMIYHDAHTSNMNNNL